MVLPWYNYQKKQIRIKTIHCLCPPSSIVSGCVCENYIHSFNKPLWFLFFFKLHLCVCCCQVCHVVTHHPFLMPVYRGTLGMRWEMSCSTHVSQVMQCPEDTEPSAYFVTAVESGMDWWRYVVKVRRCSNC